MGLPFCRWVCGPSSWCWARLEARHWLASTMAVQVEVVSSIPADQKFFCACKECSELMVVERGPLLGAAAHAACPECGTEVSMGSTAGDCDPGHQLNSLDC